MTLDLDPIKKALALGGWPLASLSRGQVEALVAEVERLRAENEQLRKQAQTEFGKQLATRTRQVLSGEP